MSRPTTERDRLRRLGGRGGRGCLGVLSGFSIGILVLPAALLFVTVLLALPHSHNSTALGLVSGLGLVPGHVALSEPARPGRGMHEHRDVVHVH